MSNQYAGGFIRKTPPTVTTSSAQGMWTLSQQAQYKKEGVWPNALAPSVIGQAFGGGYYAGKISTTANGVATHYLIVAPKASGETSGLYWGTGGVSTGFTSTITGPTNSAGEAALGAAWEAATFCESLSIGGYSDWYLPARNELEVLYYFLKPTTTANNISMGANANAVSPEPYNTNYSSGSPAQTSAGIGFRTGETNAFFSDNYWTSTDQSAGFAIAQSFIDGAVAGYNKYTTTTYVRAVRRIPI